MFARINNLSHMSTYHTHTHTHTNRTWARVCVYVRTWTLAIILLICIKPPTHKYRMVLENLERNSIQYVHTRARIPPRALTVWLLAFIILLFPIWLFFRSFFLSLIHSIFLSFESVLSLRWTISQKLTTECFLCIRPTIHNTTHNHLWMVGVLPITDTMMHLGNYCI